MQDFCSSPDGTCVTRLTTTRASGFPGLILLSRFSMSVGSEFLTDPVVDRGRTELRAPARF